MQSPSGNPEAIAALEAAMFNVLKRPPEMTVWEWLEENVVLAERESAEPGKFSTRNRPYVREPLDCFRDRRVTDLVLCFGTQTGKTITVMGGAGYRTACDPMNALWVMPNRDLAKSFSTNRWLPFVENCEPLRVMKPDDRHLWTRLEQVFMRSTLTFVGSNSPANLASRPAGLLLMDETDKFELKSDREAGALQNAEERTKSFPYPLRVKTSTPTTVHGEIWREFLLGDQRYFYVPCPCCGVKIRLIWAQVRWFREDEKESQRYNEETKEWGWDDEKVRRNTFYECQECKGEIKDAQKTLMLRGGEWRATNPRGLVGRRSYHLNSLYAPLKEAQWGLLAVKWLQSKGSLSRRQAFINSTLAEPWDAERAIDDDPLATIQYSPADLPGDRIPIMTVDVQEGHYWVVVRAWSNPKFPGGQTTWLLYEGKVTSDEELERIAIDHKVDPRRVGVDMAHKPNKVSALLVKNGWRGLWGDSKNGFVHTLGNGNQVVREYSMVVYRDPHLGTIHQSENNAKAMFIYWSNDRIKDRLFVLKESGRWNVHPGVSKEYIHQINSEIKSVKVSPQTGRSTYFWKQVRRDNHLWDCEAENVVMALAGGVLEDDSAVASEAQGALRLGPPIVGASQYFKDEAESEDKAEAEKNTSV